jgi:signal transduction histidine kinase
MPINPQADEARAFEAGGVDYIPKPLNELEVLARVRTHLALRQHRLHLEVLVSQRTDELEKANRRLRIWEEAKTHWIHKLGHELRTPLTGIFGIANALFEEIPPEKDLSALRDDYGTSCQRIVKLIEDATALATLDVASETFPIGPVRIVDAILRSMSVARSSATDVTFAPHFDQIPTWAVSAAPDMLNRALADLLMTAAYCTPSGGYVRIDCRQEEERVAIDIATQGKTLPPDDLDTFFDVGEQRTLHKGGADFGLGPALARRSIRLFDGTVEVRNGAEEGIVLEVRLPLAFA